MSKMIQLRDVPDALHRQLKARAALSGLSLSEYWRTSISSSSSEHPHRDASALLELLLRTGRAESVGDGHSAAPTGRASVAHARLHADLLWRLPRRFADWFDSKPSLPNAPSRHWRTSFVIERHPHREMVRRPMSRYVALAEALDAPLLTCDARLARSHGHRARVEVAS